jgi:hypothetical protein
MFTKAEIKRNLLGALEVALFMPVARKRFGTTYDEAVRSFIIPILLFPASLALVYLYPAHGLEHSSANTIALMYSLRMAASWFMFFGSVYWIARETGRRDHFYQFVIASNWLSVPATVVFLPVLWMLFNGTHTMAELYPFMVCVMYYTYAFTAFMAAHVLRIPWELAGFIVFIGVAVDNSTQHVLNFFGWLLS